MATLLDLTSQGDVATIADESRLADVLWGCRRSSWARSASLPSSPAWSWPTTYDTVFSIGGGMDAQLQEVRAELSDASSSSSTATWGRRVQTAWSPMDPFGEWELLGYTSAEVNEFAFNAPSRRLKVIGVGLPG